MKAEENILDAVDPLRPLDFFFLTINVLQLKEIPQRKTFANQLMLPVFCELLGEQKFADVLLGWHASGLWIGLNIAAPLQQSIYPDYKKGDAIEIFIDTRDVKTAGYATKFCHHFVILPQKTTSETMMEITHFRSDDKHELADSRDLVVQVNPQAKKYTLTAFIPAKCLHGYDPLSFQRMGFNYIIYRKAGGCQSFVASNDYANVAQTPSVWASLQLVK